MGEIELDIASCEEANQIVKAKRYFTKEQNGLAQEWKARALWLNPPYARSEFYQSSIGLFVAKGIQAYESRDIEQAIFLVTTEMNAKWFQPLLRYPICIADHRVKFLSHKKDKRGKYSHMFGCAFVYLGANKERFSDVFCQFGHIIASIKSPPPSPSAQSPLW